MRRMILGVLFTVVFLASTAPAQTTPVQITGGRLLIPGRTPPAGTAELISENFSSIGIINVSTTNWSGICMLPECRPGTTFYIPSGFSISDLHPRGNFTINGVTHNGAYYSGIINLGQHAFLIPRIARKKGLMFFTKPFTMSGMLSVCQVSDFSSGCPADKILFNGNISGHGTLTVTM